MRQAAAESRIKRGLAPDDERDMERVCSYRLRQLHVYRYSKGRVDCICNGLPTELLYVSKEISREVVPILYGQNRFIIYHHPQTHLQQLRYLGTLAVASLKVLQVRLNRWPGCQDHDDNAVVPDCPTCWSSPNHITQRKANAPVVEKGIIKDWRECCINLASALSPGQLELSLMCDTEDLSSALEVLDAVTLLPRLKDLRVCLGRTPDPTLGYLAEQIARKMMGIYSGTQSSQTSFNHLPLEIRIHVLSYTHLGAAGTYNPLFEPLRIEDNRITYTTERAYRRQCCNHCTDFLGFCCCSWRHAAFSSTCDCRRLPSELFRVSKQMNEDANLVIFSKNLFEFRQDPSLTLEFLQRLPLTLIRSIHRIKFVITNDHILRWSGSLFPLLEWQALVAFIKDNFLISKLQLALDTQENKDLCMDSDNDGEIAYIYTAYRSIIKTLTALNGLQAFCVRLGWFRDYEELAVKEVMGSEYWNCTRGNHHEPMPTTARGRSGRGRGGRGNLTRSWRMPASYNVS